MKRRSNATDSGISSPLPHPRLAERVIGHEGGKHLLTQALATRQLPNAWLVSGPKGIGKATLIYRFIIQLLAGQPSWDIPATHPAASKIRAGSHPDVLVLETTEESPRIGVEEARKIGAFLHMTAAESPYRIVFIDSVDEMNANAANAILKLLEEPPAGAMLILLSHQPGRLLPTIRSRCRKLVLHPLPEHAMAGLLRIFLPGEEDSTLATLATLASGSPGQALTLHHAKGEALLAEIVAILNHTPSFPLPQALKLASRLAGKSAQKEWETSCYLLDYLLMAALRQDSGKAILPECPLWHCPHPISRLPDLQRKAATLIAQAEGLHLDRQAVMLQILQLYRGAA